MPNEDEEWHAISWVVNESMAILYIDWYVRSVVKPGCVGEPYWDFVQTVPTSQELQAL